MSRLRLERGNVMERYELAPKRLTTWLALLAANTLLSSAAFAQLAPVSGTHYAAQASGTGGISVGGTYTASVPLDFSPADDSVPIPVAVTYNGGSRMGAAGLGWDVPLSYVYHDTTAAHRRPETATQGHERWTLSLQGETINLVLKGLTSASRRIWVPDRGHPQLEMQELKDPNSLVVYDGEGHAYFFDGRDLTNGADGTRLANGNLYLLTGITAPGNRAIFMDYVYSHPALPGGNTGLSIDLNEVFYNFAGTGFVLKNRAILRYNPATATPLAITMLGTTPLVRTTTLSTITLLGHRTASATEEIIRTYNFDYTDPTTHQPKPDPDTGLPRLRAVTMTGQQGTPEFAVTLPVASYGYGSTVDATSHQVTYAKTQTLSPPFVFGDGDGLTLTPSVAYTIGVPSPEPHAPGDILTDLGTVQNVFDLSGDGRPDFFGVPGLFRNVPDQNGIITFPNQMTVPSTSHGVDVSNKIHSAALTSSTLALDKATNVNDTLREVIDMNGDGRLDVVETVLPDIDHWIVHLNTPDPTDPNSIIWVDITVPVDQMRAALDTTGLTFGRVAMKRDTTVKKQAQHCWHWTSGGTQWTDVAPSMCGMQPPSPDSSLTRTITEFELIDVNGDGYPDFVYNGSHVEENGDKAPPTPADPSKDQFVSTSALGEMTGLRSVKVLLNTAGARLQNGVALFSAPITLEADSANGCGIERWEPVSDPFNTGNVVNQVCGLRDVNGDGIVDRVTLGSNVALGTGDMSQPFSTQASIVLPGVLARTEAANRKVSDRTILLGITCDDPLFGSITTKESHLTASLIDINGDGIPDYVVGSDVFTSPTWTVAMGTGTGFAPALDINSPPGFELSYTSQACPALGFGHPEISATLAGTYDLDGDGQPEVVSLEMPAQNPTQWDVYQLKRSVPQPSIDDTFSIPEAGRLTRIDNGYGASTLISYESAKQDPFHNHQVAAPEIVAAAVATRDSSNIDTRLANTVFYAYANPSQYFDSSADRFAFGGYGRTVQAADTVDNSTFASAATLVDTYGPAPFNSSTDQAFDNYLVTGLTRDITVLSDTNLGVNVKLMLSTDITTDTRRIAGAHVTWGTHLLPPGVSQGTNTACSNADPYNFTAPPAPPPQSDDMCLKNGFVFQASEVAWRGQPGSDPQPALSQNAVATDQEIKAADVDDAGRIALISNSNDGESPNCIQTTYANPPAPATRPHVLNAPAQRTVTDCGTTPKTLSKYTWEYDTDPAGNKLPAGQVTQGFVTAHIVRDTQGNSDIRLFDATVNSHGNTTKVTTTRNDGASRSVALTFDEFGLVPVATTVTATNADGTTVPAQTSSVVRDLLTFNVTSATDPNGQQMGTSFDGFGRVLTSTMTPTTGTAGVLSSISYQGFAKGESGGRAITQKVFTDPVPANTVATAAARTGTTHLDSLGRTQRIEVSLGSDYSNQVMVMDQRTYDLQGRVSFLADPFLSTQSFDSTYGTTYYYNSDGTPVCFVRAKHNATSVPVTPAQTIATDESNEIYPSCEQRTYQNKREIVRHRDGASLLAGSPQQGVITDTESTVTGRLLETSQLQPVTVNGATVLQPMSDTRFTYDPLGRMSTMSRFESVSGSSPANPVATAWHYDSLGQVVELDEAAPNAPQFRTYDSWGELTAMGWCDPAFGTCPASASASTANRSSIAKYDGLGRVTHREDQTKGAALAETVSDYQYDTPVNNATPSVTATNVLGRLSKATSPTSSVSYSYDPYGRTIAEVFTDRTASSGNTYVEKHDYHADGSASTLHLLLPDSTNFVDEHVDYTLDSAGRTRSANYTAGGTTQSLFTASAATDIDVLGRLRHGSYATATYDATFAEAGRRLINDVKLTTPSGKSREISFAPVAGTTAAVTAFDPLGRERLRSEFWNGAARPVKVNSYDPLGHLATASVFANGALTNNIGFTYDPLGNMLQQTGPNPGRPDGPQVQMSYLSTDRDQICGFGFGGGGPPSEGNCPVTFDAVGNITSMPTKFNPTRTLTYQPSGHVRTIGNGFSTATFDYDAFGGIQRLVLESSVPGFTESPQNTRHDKHFGGLIERRDEAGVSTITRSFPIPGGLATRHGPSGPWTFTFGETRGTRFATDQTGELVQDVEYKPFGETVCDPFATTAVCPDPGTATYTNEQWNQGDLLTATGFGVNLLGARVYDPVIGRFLSRDPIFDPGNSFNPYAFAANDPINNSDPSGLLGAPCDPLCITNGETDGGGDNPGNNTDGQGDGLVVVIVGGAIIVGAAIVDGVGSGLDSVANGIGSGLDAIGSAFSCLLGCSSHDDPHTSTYSGGGSAGGAGPTGFSPGSPGSGANGGNQFASPGSGHPGGSGTATAAMRGSNGTVCGLSWVKCSVEHYSEHEEFERTFGQLNLALGQAKAAYDAYQSNMPAHFANTEDANSWLAERYKLALAQQGAQAALTSYLTGLHAPFHPQLPSLPSREEQNELTETILLYSPTVPECNPPFCADASTPPPPPAYVPPADQRSLGPLGGLLNGIFNSIVNRKPPLHQPGPWLQPPTQIYPGWPYRP